MAFKSIPVVAAKVAGSESNFPVLVKPSAITGLGSISLAQAQSIRVYADEAKTTELAREIVSADEIYVKVSSLTTTTTIYIDYDGVRSDYAVGATYGRNAVWSDYDFVFHLEEAVNTTSEGYINSVGSNHGTGVSMALTETAGVVGNGQNFDGSADHISFPNAAVTDADGDFMVSAWYKGSDTAGFLVSGYKAASPFNGWNIAVGIGSDAGKPSCFTNSAGWLAATTGVADNALHQVMIKRVSGTWYIGVDGTFEASIAGNYSNNSDAGAIGARHDGTNLMSGNIDEVRKRKSSVSANWFETEHNNMSDNGAFWGTASDIGGAPAQNSNFLALL